METLGAYILRVLIGLDQFANAILGGEPTDTLSFRAAVDADAGNKFACIFCKFLGLFQKDHCAKTLSAEDRQRLIWGQDVAEGKQVL